MPEALDLTGQRFGQLTVVRYAGRRGRRRTWLCRCDCGNEKAILAESLRSSNSTTCGCSWKTCKKGIPQKHGHTAKDWRSRTYRSWMAMRRRVIERGISIDPRWHDFTVFLAEMGERPPGKTIDRRDNDQGYCKENCRWATPTEQSRNRRWCRYWPFDGEQLQIPEIAERTGLSQSAVRHRLARGQTICGTT